MNWFKYRELTSIVIFLIIMIICVIGCTSRTPVSTTVQQAESLMNTRPDSALTLLKGMTDSIDSYPKETQMYWHLLTIQAKDKQYITHTSDSQINQIVNFYEEYGDKEKLMMAYYYQGRVYRDMNDAPKALKAFQLAENVQIPNWDLLEKVYSQMGYLFAYQGLYDKSIQTNKKSIDIHTKQSKTNKASYAYRDIARMYGKKNQPDSALWYYEKACQIASSNHDSVRYSSILSELGCFHYDIGNLDTAKQILQEMVEKPYIRNKSNIYLYLGNIHEHAQQWDSARHYWNKGMETANVHKKYESYVRLGWMEKKLGNAKQAMQYMEEALWMRDSIFKITQTEAVAKINALYNYQHTEAENARLTLEQERSQKMMLLGLVILLLTTIVCIGLVIYHQKEKRKFQENERKLKASQDKIRNESQETIEQNNRKIKELEAQLQDYEKKKKEQEMEIAKLQVKQLKLQNQTIELSMEQQECAIKTLKKTEIYRRFKRVASGEDVELKVEDWTELRTAINQAYPDFPSKLLDLYPNMSKVETQICLLTKMEMQSSQIAKILGYSRCSITTARNRLYLKMFNEEGSTEKFNEMIRGLG